VNDKEKTDTQNLTLPFSTYKRQKRKWKTVFAIGKSVRVKKTVNSYSKSLAGKKNIHFVKCKSGNTIKKGWCSRKENRLCGVIPAKFDTIP
jgi:hypothetical protein